MDNDFDPTKSLGAMAPQEIAEYLQSIDDFEGAAAFSQGGVQAQSRGLLNWAYLPTGMILGFIEPGSGAQKIGIQNIGDVKADARLISRQIKITLDKFYVHQYPGFGKHTIVCEFAGKNQVSGETEELRYALRFEATDGSGASLSGVPVFLGLTVGSDGISFVGKTVNVRSSVDDLVLEAIDSPVFRSGLSLISTAQPALKPFAGLASAAVKAIADRNKNKQVHSFNLGLDFGSSASAARLRLGTYIVVQSNDSEWQWNDFYWDPNTQNLKSHADNSLPAVNYMAFSVGQYSG